MKLTDNFTIQEFMCHNGTNVPVFYYDNVKKLAENLQVLRDYLGLPININSGYRTPQYNKKIGGSALSQHLFAKAADFHVVGYSPKMLALIIEDLIQSGKMVQGGIGIYDSWVHYDIRGKKARWDLRTRK